MEDVNCEVKEEKPDKFKPEFKVKIKDNIAQVTAVPEKKKDGSIVMHVPSVEDIKKAHKEFKEKNK